MHQEDTRTSAPISTKPRNKKDANAVAGMVIQFKDKRIWNWKVAGHEFGMSGVYRCSDYPRVGIVSRARRTFGGASDTRKGLCACVPDQSRAIYQRHESCGSLGVERTRSRAVMVSWKDDKPVENAAEIEPEIKSSLMAQAW